MALYPILISLLRVKNPQRPPLLLVPRPSTTFFLAASENVGSQAAVHIALFFFSEKAYIVFNLQASEATILCRAEMSVHTLERRRYWQHL